jgi:transposase
MTDRLSLRLVPDQLWVRVEPLLPRFSTRPQGGGTSPLPARAVFTAVVFVVTSECAWRDLPPSFGVPFQTAHRRFVRWTKSGPWRQLGQVTGGEKDHLGLAGWSHAIIDAASTREPDPTG